MPPGVRKILVTKLVPATMPSRLFIIVIVSFLSFPSYSIEVQKFLDIQKLSVQNSTQVLPRLFNSGRVQRALDAADAAEKSAEAIAQDGKIVAQEARGKNKAALLEAQERNKAALLDVKGD